MAQRERESKRRKLIGFEKKKIKLGLFIVSALATKIFIAIA